MGWQTVIQRPGEGEKLLFKIGLMTFKASSAMTDGNFVFIETELPPGAAVEPHQHPEAEVFYILSGEFDFYIGGDDPIACGPGTFLSVAPHVRHAYRYSGQQAGRILGMMMPGVAVHSGAEAPAWPPAFWDCTSSKPAWPPGRPSALPSRSRIRSGNSFRTSSWTRFCPRSWRVWTAGSETATS
ncbi:MAG: cupin domain-containing protein [Acidobacteria bacterium]|nr:cupin domain-containing protein [Acidobacteriota bacterium]